MKAKALVLIAALGMALSGCASQQQADLGPIAPPASLVDVSLVLQVTEPGPWRITRTEWTRSDEDGFGQFVRAIADSGCTTTVACLQSAANFYRDSDPPAFLFHADCAKWVYMLRAYYASKNGLPFSYVSKVAGIGAGGDLRFSPTSNVALERRDIVDAGTGIDTVSVLQHLHDEVWTATYRMDPQAQSPVLQDFYSPKIAPGSIRAGSAIYDTTGHVMLVYNVTDDGSILYIDAHPGEAVTRGAYGAHVPRSPSALGGGFKNFRPMKLEGAVLGPDGTYVGGTVVLAQNDAIPDYSLEQYSSTPFRYNNAPLDIYQYARASLSGGGFAFNPVYELEATMGSLCDLARYDTREADKRVKDGFATLYADLAKDAALWEAHDTRVAYYGYSLKQTLADTYAQQEEACATASSADERWKSTNPLDRFVRRAPETDVRRLIAQIDDYAPFAGMRPVGY